MNFKIIGILNLQTKSDNNNEFKTMPAYMWWHTYLVKANFKDLIASDFSIVDNLDDRGEWFFVKALCTHNNCYCVKTSSGLLAHNNLQITDPSIVISKQISFIFTTDPITNIITTNNTTNKSETVNFCINDISKRSYAIEQIKELQQITSKIYVPLTMYPELKVCSIII